MMEEKPYRLACKRLNALKRRVGGKNLLEVLERLVKGYNEWRNLKVETKDIDLLETTACGYRYEHEGNYWCGKYVPRSVRKLATLKMCVVCRFNSARVQPQPKIAVGNDGLTSHEWAEQARKKMRQQQPSKPLVSENILHTCRQASENLPLMQLPCVVQVADPKNPDLKIGCRFADCETRVKSKIGSLYVKGA